MYGKSEGWLNRLKFDLSRTVLRATLSTEEISTLLHEYLKGKILVTDFCPKNAEKSKACSQNSQLHKLIESRQREQGGRPINLSNQLSFAVCLVGGKSCQHCIQQRKTKGLLSELPP